MADGEAPIGNLVRDRSGNLYGTTEFGGNSVCGGCGTVFELSPSAGGMWTETILYRFCSEVINEMCVDGRSPIAGLVMDSQGNLYGTTNLGGTVMDCPQGGGCGTVFELSPPSVPGGSWSESVLYSFCSSFSNNSCMDGAEPAGQLTLDSTGNLYGTTTTGGSAVGGGAVFELSPTQGGWTETLLHSFCANGQDGACPDGDRPVAGVTFDDDGNLYGTTKFGGSDRKYALGTVYKLSPGSGGWTETVIFVFYEPGSKGGVPAGTVSFDAAGNLYSTTSMAGVGNSGSVFRLSSKGKSATFVFNGTDGSQPLAGVLVDAQHGAVYGTTSGGNWNEGNVFKIGATGTETVLYSFCQEVNCTDGAAPEGTLLANHLGNLYGTTGGGGTGGFGLIFEITP